MISERIHMIAICGVGMGSLAGLLKESGHEVTGSDQNIYPPMSDQLTRLGVPIRLFHQENLTPRPDLVIVGNAVSRNHPEVEATLSLKIPYLSMPQALDDFFLKNKTPLVVAGTHGKTTTSGLMAWLLEGTGRSPGFLVGGILGNFNRSYQLGRPPYFVVEGDEYDSAFFDKGPKFLHYHPKVLVLNPIEFDHADIYRDLPHLMKSFEQLVDSLSSEAILVAHGENPNVRSLLTRFSGRLLTFGSQNSDWSAEEIVLGEVTRFQLVYKGKRQGEVSSPLIGRHNVENLLAVLAVLFELGLKLEEIQPVLREFRGIKRRQEIIGHWNGITLIDDFAHHPTAIAETLKALRGRYPQARLWAIFEPRSNTTRRRIFQEEFPNAFQEADRVIIGPVFHPEKIPEAERLNPAQIVEKLNAQGKSAAALDSIEAILEKILQEACPGDLICVMSNGSFGGLLNQLTESFHNKQ